MKAIPLLLFFLFLFTVHQNCLAQAPAEKPVEEQTPAEEPPAEEVPKEKKSKKKNKKEKVAAEEPPVDNAFEEPAPAEEPPIEEVKKDKKEKKGKKRKKGKKDEPPVDEVPSGDPAAVETIVEEEVPTEAPAGYKDDKKKDTWFRVFKMKRCPIKSCETKMVHIHNGKKFRGRKKLKIIQSPKTGELNRVPATDGKRKKSKKVKKNREYQKEFKLPEKSN